MTPTIPDEAVQAMPEAISDLLKKAYLQGFAMSATENATDYTSADIKHLKTKGE